MTPGSAQKSAPSGASNTGGFEKVVGRLQFQEVFDLLSFYEQASEQAKGRVWTITTWILTVNAGLIGFGLKLYTEGTPWALLRPVLTAGCAVGVLLCGFLVFMIHDQGSHLRRFWTLASKVTAASPLLLIIQNVDDVRRAELLDPEYSAPFPTFCRRLIQLSVAFALGFAGLALLGFLTA